MTPIITNPFKGTTQIGRIYQGTKQIFSRQSDTLSAYPVQSSVIPAMGLGMTQRIYEAVTDTVNQQSFVEILNPVIDVLIN